MGSSSCSISDLTLDIEHESSSHSCAQGGGWVFWEANLLGPLFPLWKWGAGSAVVRSEWHSVRNVLGILPSTPCTRVWGDARGKQLPGETQAGAQQAEGPGCCLPAVCLLSFRPLT